MKCFLHEEKEAVATCKECGNDMCAECLTYGGNAGICLECAKKACGREIVKRERESRFLIFLIVLLIILTTAFFITIVGGTIFGGALILVEKKRKTKAERILELKTEIARIESALKRGQLPKESRLERVLQTSTYYY